MTQPCFVFNCLTYIGTGYLSAYEGMTVEAVSAMTTGLDTLTPEHPAALHHLSLPSSIVATARNVRNASQEEYERDIQRLKVCLLQITQKRFGSGIDLLRQTFM